MCVRTRAAEPLSGNTRDSPDVPACSLDDVSSANRAVAASLTQLDEPGLEERDRRHTDPAERVIATVRQVERSASNRHSAAMAV